jgi:hypothetical protein
MANGKKPPLIRADRSRHMFISPPGILSFPNLFTPRAVEENQEPSFSCDLIFDDFDLLKQDYKGAKAKPDGTFTTLPGVLRAIQNVKVDQWGADPKKWPAEVRDRFEKNVKLGDEKKHSDGKVMQGYAGNRFITVRTGQKYPPFLKNKNGDTCRPEDLYGGAICRVQVLCRPWISALGKGVSLRLLGVMKVADGEKFGIGGEMFDYEDGEGLELEGETLDDFDQIQF